jgi:HAE1 family hydrophobic/amphiphilic exporter-1/multidrug efflux pump
MRPDRMAQLGVTVADISNAVNEQNARVAKQVRSVRHRNNTEELTMTVTAKGVCWSQTVCQYHREVG